MSQITETFHNLRCDRCGELLDPEYWYEDEFSLEAVMRECHWVQIGDKHYCPDCYDIDNDDNITIKEPCPTTK